MFNRSPIRGTYVVYALNLNSLLLNQTAVLLICVLLLNAAHVAIFLVISTQNRHYEVLGPAAVILFNFKATAFSGTMLHAIVTRQCRLRKTFIASILQLSKFIFLHVP